MLSEISTNSSFSNATNNQQKGYSYGYFYQFYYSTTMVISTWGLISNVLNVSILTRPEMKNALNCLLVALAAADVVFFIDRIMCTIIFYLCPTLNDYTTIFSFMWYYGLYYVETVTILFCLWLNVAMGAWRFVSVSVPFMSSSWCTMGKAKLCVVGVLVPSMLLAMPCLHFVHIKEDLFEDKIIFTLEPRNFYYPLYYAYVTLLFLALTLPILILIGTTVCLGFKIYAAFKQHRNLCIVGTEDARYTNMLTTMLTAMLVVFIVANSPSIVLLMAYFIPLPSLIAYHNLCRLFQEVDRGSTIFFYYFMSPKYRRALWRLFGCPTFGKKNDGRQTRQCSSC